MVGFVLAACTAGSQPGADPSSATVPVATEAQLDAQVDTTLPTESRSALSQGAKEALTACGLLEALDLVSGIAPIPRAADAVKYANIWGEGPYLTDKPAWLITTSGEFVVRVEKGIDPTCLVIDGDATWLMTGGYIRDGKRVAPLVRTNPPLRVPPLKG